MSGIGPIWSSPIRHSCCKLLDLGPMQLRVPSWSLENYVLCDTVPFENKGFTDPRNPRSSMTVGEPWRLCCPIYGFAWPPKPTGLGSKKVRTGVGCIEFLEILCPLCILSIIGSVVRCFFSWCFHWTHGILESWDCCPSYSLLRYHLLRHAPKCLKLEQQILTHVFT